MAKFINKKTKSKALNEKNADDKIINNTIDDSVIENNDKVVNENNNDILITSENTDEITIDVNEKNNDDLQNENTGEIEVKISTNPDENNNGIVNDDKNDGNSELKIENKQTTIPGPQKLNKCFNFYWNGISYN